MNGRTGSIFVAAAVFNWAVGAALVAAPNLLLGLLFVSPHLDNTTWVHLFGWLVIMFGVAYYLISRYPRSQRSLIRLGIVAKLGVVAIALQHVLAGDISWQILIPACADVVWALLFARALVQLRSH
jgi:hypothetical protein